MKEDTWENLIEGKRGADNKIAGIIIATFVKLGKSEGKELTFFHPHRTAASSW